MISSKTINCPVCDLSVCTIERQIEFYTYYLCKMCGNFAHGRLEKERTLPGFFQEDAEYRRALLSHVVRKMQRENEHVRLDETLIERILKHKVLPTPFEQADNLILWLGEKSRVFGAIKKIGYIPHRALIGAESEYGYNELVAHLTDEKLLRKGTSGTKDPSETSLTFQGWRHFYELQRGLRHSRTAFMAMKFNDPTMNKVYETIMKPAVKRTGFELNLLTDSPRAGLIDDRLRVEIRKARFLIADLTHANPGAYWEAGFAEGLGKPVIYTCEASVFDDPERRPHFDTNHHLTIKWNAEDRLPLNLWTLA